MNSRNSLSLKRTIEREVNDLDQPGGSKADEMTKDDATNNELVLYQSDDSEANQTAKDGGLQRGLEIVELKKGKKIRHYCKFCQSLKTNIERHFRLVHINEQEVKAIVEAEGGVAKCLMRRLKADGDASNPQPVPENSRKTARVKCDKCRKDISSHNYSRHLRKCDPDGILAPARLQNEFSNPVPHRLLSSFQFRNANVKKEIFKDQDIIIFANLLCDKYAGEAHQEKHIAALVRTVGRILFLMKEKCPQIKNAADSLDPAYFSNVFVPVVKEMGGIGKGPGGGYSHPSVPDQYGRIYRKFSKIVKENALASRNQERRTRITDWMDLYDGSFSDRVGYVARLQSARRSHDRKDAVPVMEDVLKLSDYITKQTEESMKILNERFEIHSYLTLMKALLIQLWLFNRKRVSEVDKLLLTDWNDRRSVDENSIEYRTLLPSEQLFAKTFNRITVRGKLGRPVALIVTKSNEESLNFLISLREEAGIPSDNPYIFAKGSSFMEGTKVMRDFANSCGASQPALLRGTKLRKQLAVSLQYINLNEEDLRQVAQTLGHTVDTHMKFYRKPMPAQHLGRVSKVLMALDRGNIGDYKGKNLDDINPNYAIDYETPVDTNIDNSSPHESEEERMVDPSMENEAAGEDEEDEVCTPKNAAPVPSCSTTLAGEDGDWDPTMHQDEEEETDEEEEEEFNAVRRKKKMKFPAVDSEEEQPQKNTFRNVVRRRPREGNNRRIAWLTPIKQQLKKIFIENFKTGKLPTLPECAEVITKSGAKIPTLKQASPKRLKALINNMMVKEKQKKNVKARKMLNI
ncbi:Hypothetical protein NTJ_03923 [Nesidiocoris tenuis]|uniref:Tyr recombinase domain-containing protein n=1 Tax=Nesidiocoris tenuis TaxID=355587 RepID=A0ABN7AIB6_9HEMI|nr:Hypothetical protein NTJ_03923 [Nesidiocoris tenuis]